MPAQEDWRRQVEAQRRQRDAYLRSDAFSPLALVQREHFDGRAKLTIGTGTGVDIHLEGAIADRLLATAEVADDSVSVHAEGDARLGLVAHPSGNGEVRRGSIERRTVDLAREKQFGIGFYNFLYRAEAPVRGAAIEVYDTLSPALAGFRGLEYFPIDARYRVQAEIVPRTEAPQVHLVDSAGQPRPYYIYGDLRFTLDGQAVTMEVYATTLDAAAIARDGFMLIFADATSGKESYYAGRYLDIAGVLRGAVTVDFNLARNPPCAFSPVFTCPFPRAQNRLPVAIGAGEKAYKGKTATPLP